MKQRYKNVKKCICKELKKLNNSCECLTECQCSVVCKCGCKCKHNCKCVDTCLCKDECRCKLLCKCEKIQRQAWKKCTRHCKKCNKTFCCGNDITNSPCKNCFIPKNTIVTQPISCRCNSDIIRDGSIVCTKCGVVKNTVFLEKEWNDYIDTREKGSTNSRVCWSDPINPAKTLGSQIAKTDNGKLEVRMDNGELISRDLYRIQRQIRKWNVNSNKEQSFTEVISFLNNYVPNVFNKRILANAVYIWSFVQYNGNIHRGNIRRGILCNCVFQACKNIPGCYRTKDSLKKAMNVSDKSFQAGEKVLNCHYSSNVKEELELDSTTFFSNAINQFNEMGHEFTFAEFVPECVEVYNKHKTTCLGPEKVSLKTAIAGVIYYVFKKKLSSKRMPKINQMKKILNVTNPTMRKACQSIIDENEKN